MSAVTLPAALVVAAVAFVLLHQRLLDARSVDGGDGGYWLRTARRVVPHRREVVRLLAETTIPVLALSGVATLIYTTPFDVWIWAVAAVPALAATLSPLVHADQLRTRAPTPAEVYDAGLDAFADHEDVRLVVVETDAREHVNGYTVGGPFADVVGLSRFAIERLPPAQTQAAFAHELGHHRLRHTLVRGGTSVAVLFAGTAVLSWAFSSLTPVSTLSLLALVGVERLAETLVTRRTEFQADAFAARHTSPEAMIELLRSLRDASPVDEASVPWPVRVLSTYPTYTRRIARVEQAFPESETAGGTPSAGD